MQKPSLWAARKDSAYTDEAALPNRITNIARVRIYLSICELVMFFQKILFDKMLSEIALIHKKNVRLISPALKRAGVLAYHFILKNLQLLICIPFSSCQLPRVNVNYISPDKPHIDGPYLEWTKQRILSWRLDLDKEKSGTYKVFLLSNYR